MQIHYDQARVWYDVDEGEGGGDDDGEFYYLWSETIDLRVGKKL